MKDICLINIMTYNFDTTYTQLNEKLFNTVDIPDIKNPEIILLNLPLLKYLGIQLSQADLSKKLLGANILEKPFAQAYAGHQFGYFTILGDGRAMILGEHITPDNKRFDIQLKGSGITKYSRGGDGKATIGSMLREYLYSYSMKNLGVDTSQSLAVISTDQKVLRNSIHDGAILIRVMKSHIRFGTFEYVSISCSKEEFKEFTDHVIKIQYPEFNNDNNKYFQFFQAVRQKTIKMVVEWYRVGFIHGVMNTDNMSITGETFDYGPCSFINSYDNSTTYSEIDTHKRYSFGNQKEILKWNLSVFGKTLLPLFDKDSSAAIDLYNKTLAAFEGDFNSEFYNMMKRKLGITDIDSHETLIDNFLEFLENNNLDYTNTFIELMYPDSFSDLSYKSKEFQTFRTEIKKVGLNLDIMMINNPQRILRNYLVEEAIEEYENNKNLAKVNKLLEALSSPYTNNDSLRSFQQPPSKEFDKQYKTHCNT